MTTLSVTLPNSIQRHLQEMADLDGVPVHQFVASAVAEKISALTAEQYLKGRTDRADRPRPGGAADRAPGPRAESPAIVRRRMSSGRKLGIACHDPTHI